MGLADWKALPCETLLSQASENSLSLTGSKAALAQRLLNHFKHPSATPVTSFSIIPREEESDIPYPL